MFLLQFVTDWFFFVNSMELFFKKRSISGFFWQEKPERTWRSLLSPSFGLSLLRYRRMLITENLFVSNICLLPFFNKFYQHSPANSIWNCNPTRYSLIAILFYPATTLVIASWIPGQSTRQTRRRSSDGQTFLRFFPAWKRCRLTLSGQSITLVST